MQWKNAKLIFFREVRDQLRDRRTLFMIAILPLLLYPALGIGMVQMMMLFNEQPRTVVLLGAEDLPQAESLQLLEESGHIQSKFFRPPSDSRKLNVFTDIQVQNGKVANTDVERVVSNAKQIRPLVDQLQTLTHEQSQWEKGQIEQAKKDRDAKIPPKTPKPFPKEAELAELKKELSSHIEGVQVVLVIPKGFGSRIESMNRQLASGEFANVNAQEKFQRPVILQNSADEKSMVASNRVKEAISAWEEEILEDRLAHAKLPRTFAEPVQVEKLDLAEDKQLSAFVWSKMFPALLVIMAVTGAFYPAVDLAAGEKERGTMETLLICPASRTEIVMGKFFTVMLFSISTAILNLISMGLTGKYVSSIANSGAFSKIGSLQPPPMASLLWIAVLLVPLSALFSAMCLALATFARSTKEGQYYLTPLLMVTMGLTMFCLSPGIEINPFYSVMPVVGAALLLKEMLANPESQAALYYGIPVLITSIGYSLLALWWAIDQFAREDVLFREAERFDVRLWLKHLLRDKEPTPTFAEAGICFGMIMLLQFGAMKFMQQAITSAGPDQMAERMMQLLMIQQLAIIASPALFMGVMLTSNVARTFRLKIPSLGMLSFALILPLVLQPLSIELSVFLQKYFFLPLPASVLQQLGTMEDPTQPIWLVLLAFAFAPAVCEEIAFRGFILSGFARSKRIWLAIGMSSLMFGLMHMIPQQVYNAALLGVVLGLLAIRSGSLLPCVVFHFLWNSLGVLQGRLSKLPDVESLNDSSWSWLIGFHENRVQFTWPVLVLFAAIGGFLIWRLVKHPTPQDAGTDDQEETGGFLDSPEPRKLNDHKVNSVIS